MPGTGHHVRSVLSPPIRSTGRCPGARLRISCTSTGLGAAGSLPAYPGTAEYSKESPTKPEWIAWLAAVAPMPTSIARPASALAGIASPNASTAARAAPLREHRTMWTLAAGASLAGLEGPVCAETATPPAGAAAPRYASCGPQARSHLLLTLVYPFEMKPNSRGGRWSYGGPRRGARGSGVGFLRSRASALRCRAVPHAPHCDRRHCRHRRRPRGDPRRKQRPGLDHRACRRGRQRSARGRPLVLAAGLATAASRRVECVAVSAPTIS